MDTNQKAIKVLRQLDAETGLLSELKCICDQFSEMMNHTKSAPQQPIDMQPAERLLKQFADRAKQVVSGRQKTLVYIRSGHSGSLSIRQFIRSSSEPVRSQLENKRRALIDHMHSLKTQLAGDSAVVYYSFDFYRRIVNGLADCIVEEQNYGNDGKAAASKSGKIIQRAC